MAKAKDPVCGMMVDPERAAAKSQRDGLVVYFCSTACQKKFEATRDR
jgi:Cu+-exporting ATPase